jgi:hypothetical protein
MIREDRFPDEDGENLPLLSRAGRARREALLHTLQREVVRRRRRRAAVRWGALAVLIGLGAVPVVVVGRVKARVSPVNTAAVSPREPATRPREKGIRIEVVADRPGVVDAYRTETAPLRAGVRVGDEELLSILAQAGRPAGLIRVHGAVILTPDGAGGP